MATIAQRDRRTARGDAESWEIPKGRPWYRKAATLARENPIGAISLFIVVVFVAVGLFGSSFAPYPPRELDATSKFLGPSTVHLMGTDKLGQDVFSRILAGASIDLKFGIIVLFLGFAPGVVLGIISGYAGRWVDYLIQRSAEAWGAFPQLFLLLTFIAALGPGLRTVEAVVAVGALFSGSRLLRAVALIEKHKDYVISARSTGASEYRILWRHVVPNVMPYVLVGFSSVFAVAVVPWSGSRAGHAQLGS
jgi:ABC-type dipeptide/oligopeptide/nickel transport system permease subunit